MQILAAVPGQGGRTDGTGDTGWPHLILDLGACNRERLDDLPLVLNLLSELPSAIGMTTISQPHVFPYSPESAEDRGITGTVIIAESHIAVHTYPERGWAFVDVFSCRPFDQDRAASMVIAAFESAKPSVRCICRDAGVG